MKQLQFAFLNRQPWRRLRQVLLPYCTGGFFLLIALIITNSPLLYLGAAYVLPYAVIIGLIVLSFPLSIGLNFAAKNMLSPAVTVTLIAIFALAFSMAVPLVAVQRPYPVHCMGTFTEWQSLSYHLLGFGSHFDITGCS